MSWMITRTERRNLRLAYRMLRLEPLNMALAIVLGVSTLVCATGLAVVAAWLIARASQIDALWMDLAVAAVAVRFFGVGRALFRYTERLASHKVALVGVANLRHMAYRILASSPTHRIASLRRGEILARTSADVDAMGDFVVKSVLPVVVTFFTGVATVVLFAFLSPLAALSLSLCLLLAGVVGPMLTIRSARIAELAAQQAQVELSASAQTLLMNASELAVSRRLDAAKSHLDQIETDIQQLKDRSARPAAIAAFIDSISMGAAVICGFIIGTPLVLSGQLWDVNLAILVLAPLAAFEGTSLLAPAAVQLVASASAASRVIDMMGGASAVEEALSHLDFSAQKTAETAPTAQSTGADLDPVLEAQDLSIGWPGGPVVASGINLSLRPGQALAVVGPSGIGKSTLLNTLAGLIPPVSGTLRLGGKELSTLPREAVTPVMVMTAEDAHIFQTSALENLRVARGDVTEAEATALLREAGLGSWLESAPQGLQTNLSAAGSGLSGGERRRVLLARALATPAPLLLLDEPGEHLDGAMADRLVTDLLQTGRSGKRGVLLVTHRLSALDAADQVIILGPDKESGQTRVLDQGTHRELLERHSDYRWAREQENDYV